MLYEFYSFNSDSIEKIGMSNSFNIGLNKYIDNVIDIIDDKQEENRKKNRNYVPEKYKLGLDVRTNLKKLKDNDCFLVNITAFDLLFTIAIHVMNDNNEGHSSAVEETIRNLYTKFVDETEAALAETNKIEI